MHIYENGDRCPCCGQTLSDKSPEFLELFSQFVNALGLERLESETIELEPVDFQPPPDAGIFPPAKPKL